MSEALATSADFFVRAATDDDMNYVRKTWLLRYAETAAPPIEALGGSEPYFVHHKRGIDAVLERGAVTIASRPAVPSGICGFAVTETLSDHYEVSLVHFVFVKGRWRGLGIAPLLLAPFLGMPAICTHRTLNLEAGRLPERWTFNPYLFLRHT